MSYKKKLCIVLPFHWSYLMGGSEYQIKCLLESNQLQDFFDIFVITSQAAPNYYPTGHHIVSFKSPQAIKRYTNLLDAPILFNKLRKVSPTVIYQNIGTSYAGISAYYARKTGCKMVLHISSDASVMPYNSNKHIKSLIPYIEKKVLNFGIRKADKIIAQTNIQKDMISQHYGRKVDAVIYNFQPPPKETIDKNRPLKIVWVANFKHLKQPQLFIRLSKDLYGKYPNSEFVMIGRPSADIVWQKHLEEQIKAIPNLKYLGEKTLDEVNHILANSHILVNTSLYEGFSNTFIQAWMRCMPVVSLNSNPDILLDGIKMGFYSGCYEKLRDDVSLLIEGDDLRNKMGYEAQRFAIKHFSMENVKTILKVLLD